MEEQKVSNATPQPTIEPVRSMPAQPPKSKKTLVIAFGFILISLVVAFLAGGYFLGKSKSAEKLAVVSPTIHPDTVDPTADWKTYSNNKYQFKYPKEWFISDNNSAQNFYASKEDAQLGAPSAIFSVSTFDKKLLKVTFDDPVGTRKETADKVFTEKVENLKIGDYSAFKAKSEVLEGSQTDASPRMWIDINTGTSILSLDISNGNQSNYEKILDQIFSTFKFTTSVNANDKMKSYTSKNFPVTFSYPISWKTYTDTQISRSGFVLEPPDKSTQVKNDWVTDGSGCTFFIGNAGGWGQQGEITENNIVINGKKFVDKSFFRSDKTPFFHYYYTNDAALKEVAPVIWSFIPANNNKNCQQIIDQIVSSVKFTQ